MVFTETKAIYSIPPVGLVWLVPRLASSISSDLEHCLLLGVCAFCVPAALGA